MTDPNRVDYTGRFGPLYRPSPETKPDWPMFSYDRPAYLFWNGVANYLREQGKTDDEISEALQSKDMRYMLDSYGQIIESLGATVAGKFYFEDSLVALLFNNTGDAGPVTELFGTPPPPEPPPPKGSLSEDEAIAVLDRASDHHYQCRCDDCLTWWALCGPDGDTPGDYGPFTKAEVNARQREIGEEETP